MTGWREMNVPGLRCMHPEHNEKAAPRGMRMGAPCYRTAGGNAEDAVVWCSVCAGMRVEAPPSAFTFKPLAGGLEKEAARRTRSRALVDALGAGAGRGGAGHGEPDDDDEDEGEGCPMDKELAKAMDEVEKENDTFEADAQREARIERIDAYALAMIRAGHALGPGSVGLDGVIENAVRCVDRVDAAVE